MKKFITFLITNFLVIVFSNWLMLEIVHPLWAGYWLKIGTVVTLLVLCSVYPLINGIKLWYARHLWLYGAVVAILFSYWFFTTLTFEQASVLWSLKTAIEGATFGQVFGMWIAYPALIMMNYGLGKYFFKENQLLSKYEY